MGGSFSKGRAGGGAGGELRPCREPPALRRRIMVRMLRPRRRTLALLAPGMVAFLIAALSVADMFLPRPYDGVVLEADNPKAQGGPAGGAGLGRRPCRNPAR